MMETQALLEKARSLGAAGAGVCTVEPFTDVAATMQRRIEDGSRAALTFTYNDPAIATDLRRSLPWAERLVVVASPYLPEAGAPGPLMPNTGTIARFATRDHYDEVRVILGGVSDALDAAGHRHETLIDDNRLVDRAAAVRAGVAWWGKSTMTLVPGAGPWVLLGSVATDAPLEPTTPMRRDCGTCSACLPACPTGALVAPGVIDARLCLAAAAQAPGVIPRELRRPMGQRIYGCDACLDACPPGNTVLEIGRARPRGRIDLFDALRLDDAALLDRFTHFYVPRRQARYLRRNMLVALGNGGDERARPVVADYLVDEDWLLRLHSAWAAAALLGAEATPLLQLARRTERDERVQEEMDLSLSEVHGTG